MAKYLSAIDVAKMGENAVLDEMVETTERIKKTIEEYRDQSGRFCGSRKRLVDYTNLHLWDINSLFMRLQNMDVKNG